MGQVPGTLILHSYQQFLGAAIAVVFLFVIFVASRMRYAWESVLTVIIGAMIIVMYYFLWLAAMSQATF